MARIGLLGGSFNPAHRGHRHISLAAMRALGLDEVWWLVSPGNPLKEGAKDMAPFEARFASAERMARARADPGQRFRAARGHPLHRRHAAPAQAAPPRASLHLVAGKRHPAKFSPMARLAGVSREVPIAVIPRPGYDSAAHAARAMGWLRRFVHPSSQARSWTEWSAPAIIFLRLPPDPTSATAIRAQDPSWHRRSPPRVQRSQASRSALVRQETP